MNPSSLLAVAYCSQDLSRESNEETEFVIRLSEVKHLNLTYLQEQFERRKAVLGCQQHWILDT